MIAPIRGKLCKAIFYFSFPVWRVNGDWMPVFGNLYSSFLALLFWAIQMFPVTICPWFESVNGAVVQLQGKLFILSKKSLVPNNFIIIYG